MEIDTLIEEMFVTCIEAEFWIAADMWLGTGIKCPHGNWRAESSSLAFSEALVRLHAQFMKVEHGEVEMSNTGKGNWLIEQGRKAEMRLKEMDPSLLGPAGKLLLGFPTTTEMVPIDAHFLNACRQEWALAYKASGTEMLNDKQWLTAFWSVEKAIRSVVQNIDGVDCVPNLPALWETCQACNYDRHRCPGCGVDVPHGIIACEECNERRNDV